jgi:hypothetical protein
VSAAAGGSGDSVGEAVMAATIAAAFIAILW